MMNNFFKTALVFAVVVVQADAKTLLFKNAVVHTVSGPTIEKGQVLITDGKITSVGNAGQNLAADETIDLAGQHLYPGFINAVGWLGLVEVDSIRATHDMVEVGGYTPEVQAWKAVNPDSELIPIARANGITHTIAAPGGGIVSGQSGLIQLGSGWTMEDLTAKGPTALHLFWPSMTLNTTPRELVRDKENWKSLEEQAKERRLKIKQIDDFFAEAESYGANPPAETARVPAWDAMLPLIKNEIPLVVHADSVREIKAAMEFAAKHKYRVIISGGRDAWRLAKELAAAKIPVIFERIFNDGNGLAATNARDTEPYDAHYHAPAVLAEAGVKFAITGGIAAEEATNVRNNPYYAAQAVAFGLSRDEALKSLTLYPAEMFGVADRLGSISEGKEGTVFVATGDMLDIRTQVKRVWIKGEETSLANKQTRLYEKYRSRPKKP
jgi:imidazolonepropionase-like amidohydrolase